MKILLAFLFLAGSAWAQNPPAGAFTNTNALPTNCTAGWVRYRTNAPAGFYKCGPNNTWTAFGSGSGSGSVTSVAIAATTNETAVSGTCTITTSGTCTVALAAAIDLTSKTYLKVPNSAAPTIDAFGKIAGDNNFYAAGRGVLQTFDGTSSTTLVGVLSSDTPTNGQVPVWNTGGTVDWQTIAATPGGSDTQVQYNNMGAFGGDANFVWDYTNQKLTLTGALAQATTMQINAPDSDGLRIYSSGQNYGIDIEYNPIENDQIISGLLIAGQGSGFNVTTARAIWIDSFFKGAGTLTNNYGFYIGSQGGAAATNSYPFWADEQGVFRIRTDNTFDSVYQAIPALYNPQFTKYTPGATDYERIILAQWNANVAEIGTEKGGSGTLRALRLLGPSVEAVSYKTATNCADSAGAAACGSAAAGAVVIDAAAVTVVVSTTAVTANSEIFVQYDSSLGARLSVTCNTTVALPSVTARTAGTSFTITVPAAPVTNPACYNYYIVN